MPELPEVETTARYLRKRLTGEVITGVSIRWAGSVATPSPAEFQRNLKGCQIERVDRRGKYLVFELSDSRPCRSLVLLVHLRMSGRLEIAPKNFVPNKHDHIVLKLGSGKKLCFHDTRKFGRMFLVSNANIVSAKLGIEPLSSKFTAEKLKQLLSKRKGAIKPLLLNQALIAGIGNIYADEALWFAGIHPRRRACDIKGYKIKALHRGIRAVLMEAIKARGTDAGDGVVDWGRYRPRVYGRLGQKCLRCKRTIQRMTVGQRGTHFCPHCQPLRGGRYRAIVGEQAK